MNRRQALGLCWLPSPVVRRGGCDAIGVHPDRTGSRGLSDREVNNPYGC